MNTGTTAYIKQVRDSIEAIRKYNLPMWQIDYEKYGGFANYQKIKNMYWGISSYYIDVEGKYDAVTFPLTGYDDDITKLLKEFRKDINEPIIKR